MYKFLSKNGQVLAFGLSVLLIIIFLVMSVPNAGNYYFDKMSDEEIYQVDIFNFGIGIAIILAAIAAAAMLLFGLFQVFSNPKKSMKGIIGVAALCVLAFVLYSMAPAEPEHSVIAHAVDKYEGSAEGRVLTSGNLKFIGASITTAVVLIVGAFVALIGTSLYNMFK